GAAVRQGRPHAVRHAFVTVFTTRPVSAMALTLHGRPGPVERGEWFRPTLPLMLYIHRHAYTWDEDFDRLTRVEPALIDLYREAKSYHQSTDPHFCANTAWMGLPA